MTTALVLGLPDLNDDFIIECDASGRGIGAVLMERRRPLVYFIKALSEGNLAKSTYEKELMALVLIAVHLGGIVREPNRPLIWRIYTRRT